MSIVPKQANDADALDHMVGAIEAILCKPEYTTCNCQLDGSVLLQEEEDERAYLASLLPMSGGAARQQEPGSLSLADIDEAHDEDNNKIEEVEEAHESGGESDAEEIADEPIIPDAVAAIEEEDGNDNKQEEKKSPRKFRLGAGFLGRRFRKNKD